MDVKVPEHADVELTMRRTAPRSPTAATDRAKKNALMAEAVEDLARKRLASEAGAAAEAADKQPPKPREPVDSVEVKLLDGRTVLFGPPKDISLTMRIAQVIPEAATNMTIERLARVCMSIRSIDGQMPKPIGNMVDLTLMANHVGDAGIDILHYWFGEYWGEIKLSELQLIKKNMR